MANSAVILATVDEDPIKKKQVVQTKVTIDTTATDQLVHSPSTGFSVYLKGWTFAEGTGTNVSVKQRSVNAKTGTVATTSGSTSVFGTGTAFDTEYVKGDEIVITNVSTLTISTITSATVLVGTTSAGATTAAATHFKQQSFIIPELATNQLLIQPVNWKRWILATAKDYALYTSMSAVSTDAKLLFLTQEGATSV